MRQLGGGPGNNLPTYRAFADRVNGGEPLKYYDDNAANPPWIKALAEVRRLAPREGWCAVENAASFTPEGCV
jgi:hypothetical protein